MSGGVGQINRTGPIQTTRPPRKGRRLLSPDKYGLEAIGLMQGEMVGMVGWCGPDNERISTLEQNGADGWRSLTLRLRKHS